MDEIELVVKIPEEVYRYAKKYNGSCMLTLREREMGMCMNAIANGTPLPKGHGNLVDTNELIENGVATESYLNTFIKTIIKADKG